MTTLVSGLQGRRAVRCRPLLVLAVAAGATWVADARAQPAGPLVAAAGGSPFVFAAAPEVTPPPALPAFLSGKSAMDPHDLAQKEPGAYFTGLPLVDSDPDTGFGFGARVYRYWDGEPTDPLFAYTPYRHRLFAQAFLTTNGYQYHTVDYDAPYFLDSPLRLRASLYYEQNTAANYFGRGASTLGPLNFTTAGGQTYTYSSFNDYANALAQPQNGSVYTHYNKYRLLDPGVNTTLERDLFSGLVRVQAGFAAQYVVVQEADGVTRLQQDCAAARIVGCSGGFHDTVKLGVALDTRDFEPDPNSGVFVDLTAELSSRAIGSAYDYARVTASPRAFFSPFPKVTDLVIAGRAVYSVQTDGAPFFYMNTLAFTDADRQGLGGLWTMRGYKQDRFVGAVAALTNVELRWSFVNFDVLGQNFGLSVAPFLDMGRVFDRVGDFTFSGWRRGEGAGLRVAWNKATIIVFDYGVSSEDSGLYMDFGHQF